MTTLYIAVHNGLTVAQERNGRWNTERQLEGRSTQCLAVDPLQPETVYCGTFGQGLWRRSGDQQWHPVGEGISYGEIMAVAVSTTDRVGAEGVVYAGTEPSALFRSEDGSATWRECDALQTLPSKATWSYPPRPWTHHVRCIGLDPHTAGLVIVCLENGALVRSLDGGATFHDRTADSPKDTHTLAFHERAPGRVYSVAGDGFGMQGYGYSESHDYGASWQRPDQGIQDHYGWGFAVDSGDAETMLIAMAPSPDSAHNPTRAESTIYRRTRNEPWQEVHNGLPERGGMLASFLAAHPNEPSTFFAANNLGVFHSTDAGENWERLPIVWPDHYRWQHVQALLVTLE